MSNGTSSTPSAVFTLRYKLIAAVIPLFVFLVMSVGLGAVLVWLSFKMSDETRKSIHLMNVVLFTFVEIIIALLVLEFYPLLGGDIWFEKRLIKKLKDSGKLTFDPESPTVSLIGIAHPANVRWWKLDHDDDVGFVRITETEFEYVGEAEAVKIALNSIERISEQPYPFFSVIGLKWAIIDYREGDQPKRLFMCARDKVSIRKAVAETRDITVRLMSFCELAKKAASEPSSQPQQPAAPSPPPPAEPTPAQPAQGQS